MAASISPTSRWVETYKDKTDSWLQARITHLQNQELQTSGSTKRRAELFDLRKLLRSRQAAAAATTATAAAVVEQRPETTAAGPTSEVDVAATPAQAATVPQTDA